MIRRLSWLVLMVTVTTSIVHAEMRLLATAATDSYRSLSYGVSAFCQAAGFPLVLADINAQTADTLLVPDLIGIDVQSNMWLLWLMSDQTNRQARSFSTVAILPTVDRAAAALQTLAAAYPLRTWDDEHQLWRFSRPATNGLRTGSAGIVYAASQENDLVVSASRDALVWATKHPRAPTVAAAMAIAGQVRIEIQPVTLAALLKALREQHGSVQTDTASDAPERLLSEVRALSLIIEASSAGVSVQMTITAIPDAPLFARLARMHAPAPMLWQLAPVQASLAASSGGLSLLELLDAYAPANPHEEPHAPHPTAAVGGFTGDAAAFIDRTSPTGVIYYATLLATTNRDEAWHYAMTSPQTLVPFMPSFNLATNGTRSVDGCPVMDLVFTESRRAGVTNNPVDMAAFMLRDGGMSLAATSNLLVVTIGPSNAINHVLNHINHLPPHATPLPERCRKLLPTSDAATCAMILLQPVALVHQIAESLPGMSPERMASLPDPGDGIAASAERDEAGRLRLSLRISANEIARAQQALKEGRAALQEMFMQMAVQQLLQQRTGPADPRSRAPSSPPAATPDAR